MFSVIDIVTAVVLVLSEIQTYDEGRFKKAFRVSRKTFNFILNSIRPDIEKNTVTQIPVSPQCTFVLLINRTFNSDTNTFSTSYERILCIPFANCAGGRQFFPLRIKT